MSNYAVNLNPIPITTNSNLAPNLTTNSSIVVSNPTISMTSNCNIFEVTRKKNTSNYTSQGKRKSSRTEPIRSIEDIEKFKNYFLNHGHIKNRKRNYMMFILGTSIGLRCCDLLRIKIGDVLNQDGTIKNRITTFESKTSKMNYPFISNDSKKAIYDYLTSLPKIDFDDYLFKDMDKEESEPLTVNAIYKIITRGNAYLKLPYKLGVHSFRRTFAYWTIKLHPNDNDVLIMLQEMLNHSSLRTTLRYSGIADEEYNKMYNDIGSFICNPTKYSKLLAKSNDIYINNTLDKILPDDDED